MAGNQEYYGYAPDNKRVYRRNGPDWWNEEWTFYGARGEKLFVCGGAVIASANIWFGRKLISQGGNAVIVYGQPVVSDRLGTNRTGGARYYPYGEEIGTASANDRTKFATYNRDGFTGLDYADQRFYASTYGRFNTPDPYRASGGPTDPGSLNRYAYAEGDPVNLIDPRGLFSCKPEVCGSGDDGGDGSDVGFRSQSTHPPQGNPSPPRPLLISNLEKSGKNYDQAKDTLNKIVDLIDPDCLSFLQSGGNDLKGYVSDLLSNNLLAVGSYAINYAAITNIGGTNLKPGDAAIVVNSIGAFFNPASP